MDTTLVRFVAVVLIANSHLESFYPARQLAADGLIGNALFFLISGLGLELSTRSKGKAEPFGPWYLRRLSRIYPALWVVTILFVWGFGGAWRDWSAVDYVRNLVWPTHYGFLAQIVPFYALFYLLLRSTEPRPYLKVAAALTVPYLGATLLGLGLHVLSWIFYAQMMLLGGWAAGRPAAESTRREAAVLGLTLAVYVGLKLAMSLGRLPNQVGALHLLVVPIALAIVRLGASPGAAAFVRSGSRPARAVGAVASWTLEIYLVHEFVFTSPRIYRLSFPVDVAVFWAATLFLAWGLARIVAELKERRVQRRTAASLRAWGANVSARFTR